MTFFLHGNKSRGKIFDLLGETLSRHFLALPFRVIVFKSPINLTPRLIAAVSPGSSNQKVCTLFRDAVE